MSEEKEAYIVREACHRCGIVAELGADKLCNDCRDGKPLVEQCAKCGAKGKVVPESGLCAKCEAARLKEEMFPEKPPLSAGRVRKTAGGKRKAPQVRSKAVKKAKCARCGRKMTLISRNLCGTCYTIVRKAGDLGNFPKVSRSKKAAPAKKVQGLAVIDIPVSEKIDLRSLIADMQENIAKECEAMVLSIRQLADQKRDEAEALREKANQGEAIIIRMRELAL